MTDTSLSIDDPDMTIGLMMQVWPETAAVLLRYRMRCVGCPARRFQTVAEACAAHGLSRAAVLDDILAVIA